MPYNNAIPAAGDLLSQSQGEIQQNFAAIQTLIDVNHGTFAAGDEGKHFVVSMPEQGADPATAVNEKTMYSKQSAITGLAELFIRGENSGDVVEFTSAVAANEGWTMLPSGIQIVWGRNTILAGNQNRVHAFVQAFPTACLSVSISLAAVGVGNVGDYVLGATVLTAANFTATRATAALVATAASYQFIAIGY